MPVNEPLQGLRVLMLDDEPDSLDVLCTILSRAGASTECVDDCDTAIRAVASFAPHVLVCDLYLPETDGWAFIEQVRARGVTVPAIALTAHPSAANRERALASGYTACFGKPIDPHDLVRALCSVAAVPPQ
jgi:CheY-like chemotaxis protein